ncbi:MAG TPA: ATP-binding cassette domain-containing protein [Burkholderiaceae bacterium]|nr:ATP-binding cassette domain-containing protein [Burkholderiaceae bacterium]
MIRGNNLTLRRGTKILLQDAEFTINPGERVGIVGKNGAGKSSLFALLQGKIDIDSGELSMPPDWRIASVEQIIDNPDRPAREFVIDGDTRLRAIQRKRQEADDADGNRIAELEAQLVEVQAWSAPSRAEQLLAGLGFAPDAWMRPVCEFSGGWQMRIALARALMAPSDLLLLDEPTNHLDLDAMLWLERWISGYPGTVLIISHDTEFLDACARHILHFDQCKLIRYRGGYQSFQAQRAERMRQTRLNLDRQTREAARLQAFIDRFKAQASKARQAQSRIKALARMETLAPLHAESPIEISIPDPDSLPDPLLILTDADIGYEGSHDDEQGEEQREVLHEEQHDEQRAERRTVASGLTLMVRGGDRIGILGVNGAGKSTLIKTLAGELPVLQGSRQPSKGLEIGYFAQQQLDMLDPEASALEHLMRIAPQSREQELRNYLGGFGFSGDMATRPVKPMSGGEKARLALALIVWRKPNLLLLDEPSNHLDVETREALTTALAGFGGSVLLVSHDRHLLRTTVDKFWIVVGGQVIEFDGDLEDYREWLNTRRAADTPSSSSQADQQQAESRPLDRRAQRRAEAETRQKLSALRRPLEKELQQVEMKLSRCSHRLDELNSMIADPDFYSDEHRDERVLRLAEHGELSKQQAALEEQWLALQEKLEALVSPQ